MSFMLKLYNFFSMSGKKISCIHIFNTRFKFQFYVNVIHVYATWCFFLLLLLFVHISHLLSISVKHTIASEKQVRKLVFSLSIRSFFFSCVSCILSNPSFIYIPTYMLFTLHSSHFMFIDCGWNFLKTFLISISISIFFC